MPVAQSVFGQDPFEPVRNSDVAAIIAEQSGLPTVTAEPGEPIRLKGPASRSAMQSRWKTSAGPAKCSGRTES